MQIIHVVGARPNFMKAAPVMREMARFPGIFDQLLVHTGQHHDPKMSQIFFEELHLPQPDVNLEVGSGSHAWQTAQIMLGFEPVLMEFQPDWVVVYGDVNSTLACSLVSGKLNVNVAHVEAGIRSFDRSMPEELNRLVTDQLSDLLFTPFEEANRNLENEGVLASKVHLVGNVMIDTLVDLLPRAEKSWPRLKRLYPYDRYILVTLHRPSNVDNADTLVEILTALEEISYEVPVIFPIHPRTQKQLEGINNMPKSTNLIFMEPLGYIDFLALQSHALLVLTDSGGIQEETTFLGVPCLTARSSTERPVTITMGTNQLVDSRSEILLSTLRSSLSASYSKNKVPDLWDGHTAQRIVKVFRDVANN